MTTTKDHSQRPDSKPDPRSRDAAKPDPPPSPNGPKGPAPTGQVDDNQDDLGRDTNDPGSASTNRHPASR